MPVKVCMNTLIMFSINVLYPIPHGFVLDDHSENNKFLCLEEYVLFFNPLYFSMFIDKLNLTLLNLLPSLVDKYN